jgi:streptomycin 6-kinase
LDTRRDVVEEYLTLATSLAWRLEFTPERPTGACHGDIHPGNVLVNEAGHLAFIDRARLKSCEPASDVGIVVANLVRFAFAPARCGVPARKMAEAFFSGYAEDCPEVRLTSLGYFALTCLPAAVSPVFSPDVGLQARWEALRWMRDTVTSSAPETFADWLAALDSIRTPDAEEGQ